MKKKLTVVIIVRKGMVDVKRKPRGVVVRVVDYDVSMDERGNRPSVEVYK